MAGASLSIEAGDLRQGNRRIARLLRAMGDLTPLMRVVGSILESSTIDRFEHGRGPDGAAWVPSMRALEQGGQTLVDKGLLRDSLTSRAEKDRVVIGTNLIYAGIHQFGGRAGRGLAADLPARPFLGLSARDERDIGHAANAFILGAMRR